MTLEERYKQETGNEIKIYLDEDYIGWLEEKLLSYENLLKQAQLGSCTCNTNNKDPKYHSEWCLFREIRGVLGGNDD